MPKAAEASRQSGEDYGIGPLHPSSRLDDLASAEYSHTTGRSDMREATPYACAGKFIFLRRAFYRGPTPRNSRRPGAGTIGQFSEVLAPSFVCWNQATAGDEFVDQFLDQLVVFESHPVAQA